MDMETVEPTKPSVDRSDRGKTFLNWVLALSTVPVALVLVIVAIGAVMGTAACTNQPCDAPNPTLFGVLLYGAPIVAVVTVVVSFFTARRRWGTAVPACALALQAVGLAVLFVSF
jgi:hypothetical protein